MPTFGPRYVLYSYIGPLGDVTSSPENRPVTRFFQRKDLPQCLVVAKSRQLTECLGKSSSDRRHKNKHLVSALKCTLSPSH